jgi:Protein of unknown function with HXXEE motif
MVLAPVLAVLPLVLPPMPVPLLAIYLLSPGYMLHQVEEHLGDRFRRFVNHRVFGGVEALTPAAVFWINVPLVWGVNAAAVVAAAAGRFDLALVAVHLMLVNAAVHILGVVRFGYNPGLATSVGVFLPLGAAAVLVTGQPPAAHLVALAVAVVGHALLVGYALLRVRRLGRRREG